MSHHMLIHHVIHFFAFVVAFLITAKIVPGIRVRSFGSAVVFALVFAVFEKILFWPFVVVTLPLMVLTLGLFRFVINAFLLWLADKVVKGVEIDGFGTALLGAIVVTAANWAITYALHAFHL